MALTVEIHNATGVVTGTFVSVTAVKWNTIDNATNSANPIATPTPGPGTNFSFVKTFQIKIISGAPALAMSSVKVGKVANETTSGTKLWHVTSHTTYVQATAAPGASGSDAGTPTINGAAAIAGGLTTMGTAPVYAAGPFNTNALQGNLVEIVLGVDSSNTTAGTTVATPTLRWQWTES